MDHRKDFQWLVMDRLGRHIADRVEWSAPRVICIAADFTRYDGYAVQQISRSVELLRYRRFPDNLLMIELVHSPRVVSKPAAVSDPEPAVSTPHDAPSKEAYQSQRIEYRLANASPLLRDTWDASSSFLTALGDDVQVKELKFYVAFKRIKNFACLQIQPQAKTVTAYVKLDPDCINLEEGFTRDVSKIGHFGTGDLEITMRSLDDLRKAQPLLQQAYEGG